MGVKADNAQIGQSATASQNFNLRAPLDGTLRISRGNAGSELTDPIKIESNNDVTLAGNLLSGVLGTGQTWQDMTASRALGTTYTNTTGKPIVISGYVNNTSGGRISITVGGVVLWNFMAASGVPPMAFTAVIPVGATYSVNLTTGTATLAVWTELR